MSGHIETAQAAAAAFIEEHKLLAEDIIEKMSVTQDHKEISEAAFARFAEVFEDMHVKLAVIMKHGSDEATPSLLTWMLGRGTMSRKIAAELAALLTARQPEPAPQAEAPAARPKPERAPEPPAAEVERGPQVIRLSERDRAIGDRHFAITRLSSLFASALVQPRESLDAAVEVIASHGDAGLMEVALHIFACTARGIQDGEAPGDEEEAAHIIRFLTLLAHEHHIYVWGLARDHKPRHGSAWIESAEWLVRRFEEEHFGVLMRRADTEQYHAVVLDHGDHTHVTLGATFASIRTMTSSESAIKRIRDLLKKGVKSEHVVIILASQEVFCKLAYERTCERYPAMIRIDLGQTESPSSRGICITATLSAA